MLIVDQHTFEVVHCHTFMQQEYACSIMSCKLGEDNTPYYVVGTGFIHPEESEPKTGRLIVFSWADGKLTQVRHVLVLGGDDEYDIDYDEDCITAIFVLFYFP